MKNILLILGVVFSWPAFADLDFQMANLPGDWQSSEGRIVRIVANDNISVHAYLCDRQAYLENNGRCNIAGLDDILVYNENRQSFYVKAPSGGSIYIRYLPYEMYAVSANQMVKTDDPFGFYPSARYHESITLNRISNR